MHTRRMMLLKFSAENHRCFKDKMVLDMVRSTLKTKHPPLGTWRDHVHPVAGIFGSNASGKSTVLDAMAYAQAAVAVSSTHWLSSKGLPRQPFKLEEHHSMMPSRYHFDIVIRGIRYEYGFALSTEGVVSEWLIDYPKGRRRLLFDRAPKRKEQFDFGRSLMRPASIAASVSPQELFLSRAALLEHPQLGLVANAITEDIDLALFGDPHRHGRVHSIIEALVEGTTSLDNIATLLQVADIGIERVGLREEEMPQQLKRLLQLMQSSLEPEETNRGEVLVESDINIQETRHFLEFFHANQSHSGRGLGLSEESDGTITWLSLAVPAIEALRRGAILLVDEIDASLHPQLSSLLINLFLDRDTNPLGSQLIFTSHDTFLLSNHTETQLDAEQIWFTEKASDGSADLYCLADFANRSSDNIARRYLSGRYGAIPRLAPSLLKSLLEGEE